MHPNDPMLTTNNEPPRRMHWLLRIPLKWSLFTIVVFFVLFPNPAQLYRHITHLSDYEAMIDADAAELAPWEAEIRRQLESSAEKTRRKNAKDASKDNAAATPAATAGANWNDALSPKHVQKQVERFIYKKVRYGWDWDVWGSADYMPTVAEMFDSARRQPDGIIREDCDGRAVMAASLMRRLGYESSIATDLRHVWVETPQGKWMGPGRGKSMKSTKQGNETNILGTLSNLPVGLSYGIAVFPFWRELIITLTLWLLLSRRRMGAVRFLIGGILLLQGLLFMRTGVFDPTSVGGGKDSWPAWTGVLHIAGGIIYLYWAGWRVSRSQSPQQPAGE